MKFLILTAIILSVSDILGQKVPNFQDGHNTIIQMFEWKWSDIADECEQFLGPNGFGGVQTSPPNENIVWSQNGERTWWEIYQPVSYELTTRHGDEAAFKDMIQRCNKVGVRIYPDVVVNHMASISDTGTAGHKVNPATRDYPDVPYTFDDFHPTCGMDYNSPVAIRNCELSGLPDLNQTIDRVREEIEGFLNHLIELGAAGFRMDAAKHMWPSDLQIIYSSLKDLNTDYFPAGSRAFIFQEVIDYGNDVVSKKEYIDFGRVNEFKYGNVMGPCFRGECPFTELNTIGFDEDTWGSCLLGEHAVFFIGDHDTERDYNQFLNYKDGKTYRAAVAFMLAHHAPAITRITSGFDFNNRDIGPPHDDSDNILSPVRTANGCSNGWNCEHRWTSVVGMVGFKNQVEGTGLEKYWTSGNRIAFSRGDKGFFAVSANGGITESIPASIPDGTYCDVVTGNLVNGQCTGSTVTVSGGNVQVNFSGDDEIAMGIHVGAKL